MHNDLLLYGLLLVFIIGSSFALWATFSQSSFSVKDWFVDKEGRASLFKLGQFIALTLSSWGFIVLVARSSLTEFYFIGYMSAWVLGNLGSKLVDGKLQKEGG